MKIFRVLIVMIACFVAVPGFAQDKAIDVTGIFDELTSSPGMTALLRSVPLQATIGNEWGDAYIGDDSPPNFGIGITGGATFIPMGEVIGGIQTSLNDILKDAFEIDASKYFEPIKDLGFPVPAYAVDLRTGIKAAPIDIGVKFGYLPVDFSVHGFPGLSIDYLLAGGDIRYAVLQSKAVIIPDIIFGLGYSYINTNISFQPDASYFGTFVEAKDGSIMDPPSAKLSFGAHVVEAKVQAGWRILFFEPFIGFSGIYSSALVSLETDGNLSTNLAVLNDLGVYKREFSDNLIYGLRPYGGFGLKLFWFHLDFGAGYELLSGAWTVYSGFRFQL